MQVILQPWIVSKLPNWTSKPVGPEEPILLTINFMVVTAPNPVAVKELSDPKVLAPVKVVNEVVDPTLTLMTSTELTLSSAAKLTDNCWY